MDNFLSWAQLLWLLSNNWLLVEKLAEARIVQWYPCPGYLKLFPLAEAAAELAEEVGHVCGQTSVISTSAVWKVSQHSCVSAKLGQDWDPIRKAPGSLQGQCPLPEVSHPWTLKDPKALHRCLLRTWDRNAEGGEYNPGLRIAQECAPWPLTYFSWVVSVRDLEVAPLNWLSKVTKKPPCSQRGLGQASPLREWKGKTACSIPGHHEGVAWQGSQKFHLANRFVGFY